ncbi:MAG TPA: histidine phosphatase family protein, partial [Clostridia bacterium]|nr:histidine phosphatase family protein [Clostridia bacterium]
MILLLRHGKTEANERRLYAGALDWPLSEAGRAELLAYWAEGLYPKAQAFYTSGMLRCEQTLELLYGPQPHQRIGGLSEYRFGAFEGRSYEQLKEDPAYRAWIGDSAGTVACPGGESKAEFRDRIAKAFESLAPWLSTSSLA